MAEPLENTFPTVPKPTMQPEESRTTIDTPAPARVPLQDGKKSQEEEEGDEDEEDEEEEDEEDDDEEYEEDGEEREEDDKEDEEETMHEQYEAGPPTRRHLDEPDNGPVDRKTRTELQEIVSKVPDSDEATQFADVFEDLAQYSPALSSPYNPSHFDIFPVIMALLKPIVLSMHADIRSILIWLCKGEPGSTIDGKAAVDKAAKQALLADQTAVMHPNGTIFLVDLFDSNLSKIARTVSRATAALCSRA
ncbi:hypothetical protein BGZ92_009422 [Podila epicladia]|nr:hypothetical protein BGZ92_009422 [Podila epicladia]